MTGRLEAWVPHFTIGVPLKKTPLERVQVTVESILQQSAVITGKATVSLRIVASDLDAEVTSWLFEQDQSSMSIQADVGSGLYSAVAQALAGAPGDFFGYLGGGDVFESSAFSLVLEAAQACGRYDPIWVTGLIRGRREDGAIVRSLLPFRYTRRNFQNGLHGTILPTIQQESTLWSRTLNDAVDWQAASQLQLAGDYLLWQTFSAVCQPVILEAAIGSFTWHGDNRSSDWALYQEEVRALTRRPTLLERFAGQIEKAAWGLPAPVKIRVSSQVRRYLWPDGPWR